MRRLAGLKAGAGLSRDRPYEEPFAAPPTPKCLPGAADDAC
jgi:hypothetical protein